MNFEQWCQKKEHDLLTEQTIMGINNDSVILRLQMALEVYSYFVREKEAAANFEFERKQWYVTGLFCPMCGSAMIQNRRHIECSHPECIYISEYL